LQRGKGKAFGNIFGDAKALIFMNSAIAAKIVKLSLCPLRQAPPREAVLGNQN